MALTVTGIVLMIIASLLYYVTVQEIRQIKAMVRTSSDVENLNTEKIWKKLYILENDISRIRMTSSNAARNADEALKKINDMSFGDYIPKHGKEHE
jgi:exoribonuclease R